jgi:hypothetical protein
VKFQIPDRYFQKINSDGKQPARWTAPKRDCFLKTLSSVLYMNRLLFMFKNILTSAGSTLREFSLSEIFRFVRGIHPEPEVPRVLYFRLNSAISHPPPAGGVERQSERFKETAREVGADENSNAFDRIIRKMAEPKPFGK